MTIVRANKPADVYKKLPTFCLRMGLLFYYAFGRMFKLDLYNRLITGARKASFFEHARRTPPTPPTGMARHAPLVNQIERPIVGLGALFKHIGVRIGFTDKFGKALEPMMSARTVGGMQRFFQSLPDIVQLSRAHPHKAYELLEMAAQSPKALYAHLTAIACGNTRSLMPAIEAIDNLKGNHILVSSCIHRVAQFKPREAQHLLRALMEHDALTASSRLAIFRELAMSRTCADKGLLIGGFELVMRGSTGEERNHHIYPTLLDLMEKWKPLDPALKLKRALTEDMLRGWISSCAVITDKNHRNAQRLLNLPPSARG